MHYTVRHLTRFVYTSPVCESVMELRMQPLDVDRQRCLNFSVNVSQRARVFAYRDYRGNAVHYFDIPGQHSRLDVSVESSVDIALPPVLPAALPMDAWDEVDAVAASDDQLAWLASGPFTAPTLELAAFAAVIGLDRSLDPLTTLRTLTSTIYAQFAYMQQTTQVDSQIDDALRARAGVCQDFSHIMLALVRGLGIPSRYVSGYIAPQEHPTDRAADNATHAWMEALLPSIGWVGFDPTNDTIVGDGHIAVAIGRDYSDVPPTRGVFKGAAGSELSVAVAVTPNARAVPRRDLSPSVSWIVPPPTPADEDEAYRQQQQQQQ
ncbi:MAG: transglutaminase family protein [Vicinamibacterales bacterium]